MGSTTDSPVPIVDFGPFYAGDNAAKKAVAEQLDEALHTVGFVYLKNHGVPQEKVDGAFEWVRLHPKFQHHSSHPSKPP